MAAPGKRGLEYFSFDTNFFQDIKVRKLIKNQTSKAIPVYAYLLCMIYREGYYIAWDEDLPFIVSEATGYNEDYVNEVIQYCLEAGLFSADLFRQNQILTSKGIQARYLKIMASLKRKVVYSEFKLVNTEETAVSSEVTVDISELMRQREEKRIKESKGKEEEKKASPSVPDFVDDSRRKLGKDPPELRQAPLSLIEYESKLLENRQFVELTCMNRKVSESDFNLALREFIAEKDVLKHQPKSEQDLMQHFWNWLQIWKDKREKNAQPGKLKQSVKNAIETAKETQDAGGFYTFSDLQN